jgi:hypothetical protein
VGLVCMGIVETMLTNLNPGTSLSFISLSTIMFIMIVYLVVLSVWLNSEMKQFGYGENMFVNEREALKSCMFIFVLGYAVQVLKNLLSYTLPLNDDIKADI